MGISMISYSVALWGFSFFRWWLDMILMGLGSDAGEICISIAFTSRQID